MSSIQIAGNTSGTITLDAPNVAGTTTLTLPTTSGTVLTSASSVAASQLPTGSVLQVVNTTYSTYSTFSSSTYADTGLTESITPSSSSNKILVLVHITGMGKSGSNTSMKLQLLRGSSSILVFEGIGPYNNATTANMVGGTGTTYLDSPATTSSTTYKVQIQSVANTSLVSINDFTTGAAGNCTMTLMEIKG